MGKSSKSKDTKVNEPVHTPEPELEQFEFRKLLDQAQLRALKASTPDFIKTILHDISTLTKTDKNLEFGNANEAPLDSPPADEELTNEPKAGLPSSILHRIKLLTADPVKAAADLKVTLLKGKQDIDEKLATAEKRLQEEEEKIKLEVAIAAQLEEVLETLKKQLPNDSSLSKTIEQIEKKLNVHRQSIFLRSAFVPALRNTVKTYLSFRDKLPKN